MSSTASARPAASDLVVVGAGIVGVAHALEALDAGLSVTLVDREHRAVGASRRNFGHVCATAQHGELLDLAMSSREGWLRAAEGAGLEVQQHGTLVLADSELAMRVLGELADDRGGDQVRLVDAAEARDRLGGLGSTSIVGGAHLPLDLRVDPRSAIDALTGYAVSRGARLVPATQVGALEVEGSGVLVRTSRGDLRAGAAVVATGHDVGHLFPDLAEDHRLERCTLQMALVDVPRGATIDPAVLTTTSMLRYDAFTAMPSGAALREQVTTARPDLLGIVANVMLTQRPDGTLLVGDSHHYAASPDPFLAEEVSDLLLAEVAEVLGVERLTVRERWQGIYASSPVGPLLRAQPVPGVHVVTVSSGIGMTLSFGLARQTVAQLVSA